MYTWECRKVSITGEYFECDLEALFKNKNLINMYIYIERETYIQRERERYTYINMYIYISKIQRQFQKYDFRYQEDKKLP